MISNRNIALTTTDFDKLKKIFATKTDLKRFATKSDLDERNVEIFQRLDEVFKDYPTIEQINELVGSLPTKDEFFTAMDKLMKKLKDSREEQTILSHRVSNHSDQIEKIQSHLNLQTSS